VQYQFGTEDGVEYLECFTSHRMTNDRMYRVYADGRVEMIDALIVLQDFGTGAIAGRHARAGRLSRG
jgi:hypothetical protein